MLRLDKFVSETFSVSRRDAKRLLREGRVTVNEKVIKDASCQVAEDSDIQLDGQTGVYRPFVYIMMNKPKGVISASKDRKTPTAIDLLPEHMMRHDLFVAGRLDKDTTGFLLITNDGPFAHDILSPKHHVDKTYLVTLDQAPACDLTDEFKNGVTLSDGTKCKPAVLRSTDQANKFRLTLTEGKFHQVKRMFSVFGYTVEQLHRESIGNLMLKETLPEGGSVYLTENEISELSNVKNNQK